MPPVGIAALLNWATIAPVIILLPPDKPDQNDLTSDLGYLEERLPDVDFPNAMYVHSNIFSQLTPESLQATLARWITDPLFESSQELDGFMAQVFERMEDVVAHKALEHILDDAAAGDISPDTKGFAWEEPDFIRSVKTILSQKEGPVWRRIEALIDALAAADDDTSEQHLSEVHRELERLDVVERLDRLLRAAADESRHNDARVQAAEEGFSRAMHIHWHGYIASFADVLFKLNLQRGWHDKRFAAASIEVLRTGLKSAEKLGDLEQTAYFQGELASALSEFATLDEPSALLDAIQLFRRALDENLHTPPDIVALRKTNYSVCLHRLAQIDHASSETLMSEAVSVVEDVWLLRSINGSPLDKIYTLSHRGLILSEAARISRDVHMYKTALESYDLAVSYFEADSSAPDELLHSLLIDRIYCQHGGLGLSIPVLKTDLMSNIERAIRLPGMPRQKVGEATAIMGYITEDPSASLNYLLDAQDMLDATLFPHPAACVATAIGRHRAEQADWSLAADSFRLAYTIWDESNASAYIAQWAIAGDAPANTFLQAARWAAYCLAMIGELGQAVAIVEQSLCRHTGWSRRHAIADLSKVSVTHPDLAEMYSDAVSGEVATRTTDQHSEARENVRALVTAIRRVGYPEFMRGRTLETIGVRASLHDCIVYLVPSPWGSICLLVSGPFPQDVRCVKAPLITSGDIATFVLGMTSDHTQVESRSFHLAKGRRGWMTAIDYVLPEIGARLMRPLVAELLRLGVERVTLISTGMLASIPVAGAPVNPVSRECLLDHMPVMNLPAAAFQLARREMEVRTSMDYAFLAVADPEVAERSLPGTRREAEAALSAFSDNAQALFGPSASARMLAALVNRPVDLHFGCHARRYGAEVGGAELLLADGAFGSQALARAGSAAGYLGNVFMAACDSGAIDLRLAASEASSLATTVLGAGAATAITAAWRLDDASTSEVVSKFYMFKHTMGLEAPEAMRAAVLWLRDAGRNADASQSTAVKTVGRRLVGAVRRALGSRESANYAHEYYWAGFLCHGTYVPQVEE